MSTETAQAAAVSNNNNADSTAKQEVKFVDNGPPPDMRQRALIFDSLGKIVTTKPQKTHVKNKTGESRGTYVFTWGAGYQGQLGRKFGRGQAKYTAVPMMVDLDVVVRQVECGGLHTACVTEDGRVYTWGNGKDGELGHHHDPSMKQIPRQVENLENIFVTFVACGGGHTIALNDQGSMWSWGLSWNGQTGQGERKSLKTPKRVDHPLARKITKVACGNKHTIAINDKGQALAFGCSKHGQTGLGTDEDTFTPTIIEALQDMKVTEVGCGAIHSCLITDSGDLFLCGFGEYFHPNESQHFFYEPKQIELPEPAQEVACGQAHNIVLSNKGNVYGWGSGEYGQIGYGIKGNLAVPRLVLEGKNIASVAAGRYHSFALSDAGILYSWGCGENGQLGLGSDENVALPSVVTTILGTVVGRVSCGEHHTAVITSAPWSKISQDIARWHHASKVEYELKTKYLNKTHRGLTAKDLLRLGEEMTRWQTEHEQKRKEMDEQALNEYYEELKSIEKRKPLRKATKVELDETLDRTGQIVVPTTVSADADDDEQPVSARTAAAKAAAKKAAAAKKSSTSPLTSYRRTSSKKTSSARSHRDEDLEGIGLGGSTVDSNAPVARAAFLKETAQMVKRMTSVVADKGESQNQKHLQKMLRLVFGYRKEYDDLRHKAQDKQEKLETLKNELALSEQTAAESTGQNNEKNSRLEALKMQLNTVTIKIGETGENRKNYELNIAHLKEEDFDHFNQLKVLRRQMADTNTFFKKMNDLRMQSLEEKDKAESELLEFQHDIAEYQEFVQAQLEKFRNLLKQTHQQTENRERAKQKQSLKSRTVLESKLTKLVAEADSTEKEGTDLAEKLMSLDLKLRHFEDRFQQITAATGLTNPDAIVNKFVFKGEIKEQLQAEIDDKQEKIEELRLQEEKLQAELEEDRRAFREDRWRDIEGQLEDNRTQSFRNKRAMKDAEKVTSRLAMIQEGILSLFVVIVETTGADRKLIEELEIGSGQVWQPEQSNEVFSRCEKLLKSINAQIEEASARREEMLLKQQEEEEELEKEQKKSAFGLDMKALQRQKEIDEAKDKEDEANAM